MVIGTDCIGSCNYHAITTMMALSESVRTGLILVLIHVETFKTDIIVFTGNVTMCLMSHRPGCFTAAGHRANSLSNYIFATVTSFKKMKM